MATKKHFALVPELVPAPLFGRCASQMLRGKALWRTKIRPDTLATGGNCCCICGAVDGPLICHDKWQYDDKAATATLTGFEIHCRMCDAVTHVGRNMQLATQAGNPQQFLLAVLNHLCAVNRCPPHVAEGIIADSMTVWERRSKKRWTVKVAPSLVKQYPELAALPEFTPPPISSRA